MPNNAQRPWTQAVTSETMMKSLLMQFQEISKNIDQCADKQSGCCKLGLIQSTRSAQVTLQKNVEAGVR
jgi:hypothetical protein